MLSDIKEVATILYELSDRFQEAQGKESQRIAKYFEQIEQCLRNSIRELENHNEPIDQWGELKIYADNLYDKIGAEIGQEQANRLSELLRRTSSDIPQVNSDISSIKSLAGQFKGLAFIANTNTGKKSRRSFLSYIPISIGTAGGLIGSYSLGKTKGEDSLLPIINWNMTTFLGEDHEKLILYNAPQMVCNLVAEMTNKRFTIELSRTGKTETILENVSKGNVDCGYSGIYYNKSEYRPLFFSSAIPFGLSPQEQNFWLYYKQDPSDELTYIQKIYEKIGLNVITFPAGGTGGQMGGWFKKPISSIADLKGLKMRIPALGGDVLDRLGVKIYSKINGSPLKISEIKTKLRNNEIQAAEWIGFHDDFQLGLNKVAKYYYYPGWWEPSTTFDVQINKDKWSELPDNYKAILKTACAETHIKILAEYNLKNAKKFEEIRQLGTQNDIKISRFNNEILEKAKEETENLFNDYSQNPLFEEVYKEWSDFKERIREWSNYSNYTQTYELPFEFHS